MKYVVFDMDGVLSDHSWRKHLLEVTEDDVKPDWTRYHLEAKHDMPNPNIAELYVALHKLGYRMIILTARPAHFREPTITWLLQHNFPCEKLIMRPDDDFSSSAKLKILLLRINNIFPQETLFAIDDRLDIVLSLIEAGYTTFSTTP